MPEIIRIRIAGIAKQNNIPPPPLPFLMMKVTVTLNDSCLLLLRSVCDLLSLRADRPYDLLLTQKKGTSGK
jgi:hypothetical protein